MQISKFILSERVAMQLSGEASEWLFFSGFWSKFNAENKTTFDQFEEEDVSPQVLEILVRSLKETKSALSEKRTEILDFPYRWTANGGEVVARIFVPKLQSELDALCEFLVEAARGGLSLVASL